MGRLGHKVSMVGLCLALWGCVPDRTHDGVVTIACLGDSNTQATWAPTDPLAGQRWCERLAAQFPGYRFLNQGRGGAAVIADAPFDVTLWDGTVQLAAVPQSDLIIAAFLTNDVGVWHRAPSAVVTRLQAWQAAVAVPIWVVLGPVNNDPTLRAMNEAVVAGFPRTIAVAHPTSDFDDAVHLNAVGQARRTTAIAMGAGL